MNVSLILLASVAWNFPDGKGGVAEISDENILRLDEEAVVAPFLKRLEEMYRLQGPADPLASKTRPAPQESTA
jgi:hypothetical protein